MPKIYDAIIIGGGAIGLSTCYYMRKAGYDVLVLEKDDNGVGCSYGNAGLIVPSHFVPLASPGIIWNGIKWMFSPQSPFSITPKLDIDMIRWLILFSKYCSSSHVDRTKHLLFNMNMQSKELYKNISTEIGFKLEQNGLIMLYQTKHGEEDEKNIALLAADLGVDVAILKKEALQALEPAIGQNVLGGVHYKCDAHLDPTAMMRKLATFLVDSIKKENVIGFTTVGTEIKKVRTHMNEYLSNNVIVCSGYWSKSVLKLLKTPILLESGKGYSFKVPMATIVKTPFILTEARVAVTPMNNQLQFAGTMEVGQSLKTYSRGKIKGIINSIKDYLPSYAPIDETNLPVWAGLRPLSPDGLPYIGKSSSFNNLYIGTGHAMMGISLAPFTGKLLTDIISGQQLPNDYRILSPNRFSR